MIRVLSRRGAGPLVLVGLSLAVGCGRVETDEPPAPEDVSEDPPEDETPDGPDEVQPDGECLSGLVEPSLVRSVELPAALRAGEMDALIYSPEGLTGAPLLSEVRVTLALGTEAPSSTRLRLGSIFDAVCGAPEGQVTIDAITVHGNARVTTTEDPTVVAVEAEEAGDYFAEVEGMLRLPGGDACSEGPLEVPLLYSLLIHAEEFDWSVEPAGTCPTAIASGRPLPVVVQARDSAGQVVSPNNIQAPALSVSASAGVDLKLRPETPVALSDLVPLGSGTVTVALADGSSALDVRVHEPEELNGFYLEYWLTGIVARGDWELEDGESAQFVGVGPRLEVRARWVALDGGWLCGAPDAGDLWVTSLTPEVCPVESRICQPQDGSTLGSLLYESIPIIANGTCTLRIDAPAFEGGAGVSEEFTIELTDQNLPPD